MCGHLPALRQAHWLTCGHVLLIATRFLASIRVCQDCSRSTAKAFSFLSLNPVAVFQLFPCSICPPWTLFSTSHVLWV